MTYNLTGLTNGTGIGHLAAYANASTDGLVVGLMLIGFYLVMLVSFVRRGSHFDTAILASSFIAFVIATLLRTGGLVNTFFLWMFLTLTAGAAFIIVLNRKD